MSGYKGSWLAQNKVLPGVFYPDSGNALDSVTIKEPEEPKVLQPLECKNCGAPLHGSRCEYCGTEYGSPPVLIFKGQPADMDKLIDQLHKTGIVPVKSETEVTNL